ncbi:uncharacterized protein LOC105844225 [Hydra vulgaris]|uniref:Uncharacterized protein LOC105844225 n=1 Tax=Hydra vulgaris TaxID=6087 RepID=A0ABM4CNG9_HYDVU
MKMIAFLILTFLTFSCNCSSLERNLTKQDLFKKLDDDRTIAQELINYVYMKYPYYLKDFMDFDVNKIKGISEAKALQTTALEVKRKKSNYTSYELLLTEINNDKPKNVESEHKTSLFLCSRAIRYGNNNPRYIEYREGEPESSIIILSSHDGHLRPKYMPDRDAGCWIDNKCVYNHNCEKKKKYTKNFEKCGMKDFNDNFSTDIIDALEKHIASVTGYRPHVVVNHLHRSKLDVNREIDAAAFGVPDAEQAWKDFHNFVRRAKKSLNGRRGIIFDLHGNDVSDGFIMLGYGLQRSEMEDENLSANTSSIQSLAENVKVPFEQLVRGELSLGFYLSEKGYLVIPSPKIRRPRGRHYYRGSYSILEHGSNKNINGGNIDAIQIEVHSKYRNDYDFEKFAEDLAFAIKTFYDNNYKLHMEEIVKDSH